MRKKAAIKGLFCPSCASATMILTNDVAQSGRKRYKCQTCQSRTTQPSKVKPQVLPEFNKEKAERYIVFSAQNNTGYIKNQLATYERMAEYYGARIIALPTKYINPDKRRQGSIASVVWPAEIVKYICTEEFAINKNLVLRGDVSVSVTQINPLMGVNHASHSRSEIFGHAQVAMQPVATPRDDVPKILMTTGTISHRNYGRNGYAKKAEKHHSNSALFIEVKGSKFWPTDLPWDGKGVELYGKYFTPGGVRKAGKMKGIVYGDIHNDMLSKKERQSLETIIHGVKAKKNVLHDLLDFHTGSHHKEHNVIENLRHPDFDIRGEIERAIKFLEDVPNPVVVTSNHNEHLDQWFNRYDPRRADQNIQLYAELMGLAAKTNCDLFQAYATDRGVKAEYTNRNKKFMVGKYDCSQHFDKGPNGARGSAKGFARTGVKTIGGHSHTPCKEKGAWQVGTSAMGMAYANGYSSWLVAHCFVNAQGKRSMIFVIQNQLSPLLQEAIDRKYFA